MDQVPSATQRVLDAAERKGVKLEVVFFDQSTHTADDAARAVGAEVGQIVKSLVFVSDDVDGLQPCLVLVSGANTVDLALLGAVLTVPRIRRATADEARELTGFSIGGIPPFGHRQQIRTVMDPDLTRYDSVWAAAGTANAVFPLPPNTLRILTGAVVTPIAAARQPQLEQEQPQGAPTNA
ncbi:MAG: YbaK/EbsC family protein [Chloroflexi bacterium]|nr:YbaK/EbsC family protein [Chloroflexota bacterium]